MSYERETEVLALLGRLAVGRAWLDVTERGDPGARILEEAPGRVVDRLRPEKRG